MRKTFGFTIIELLIVISVIGILSGILLMVIDPRQSQNIAQDSVRISTLEGLAQVMQTYVTVEGSYPTGTGDANLAVYLDSWPDAIYEYATQTDPGVDYVCLSVPMVTNDTAHFKYVFPHDSSITEGIEDCVGKILKSCGTDCSDDYIIDDCFQLNDIACEDTS